jgi:galactokinase
VARYHAPGRVNLIGEHTDYAGGLVLPVAIDRGVTLTCEPAGAVDLRSTADPARVEGFGRYVESMAAELERLGIPAAGIQGEIASDLPIGAGLASSAALLVAVGLALLDAAGAELDPMALADACRRAEERAVGVPCGIMDQAASMLGREGHALLLDTGTLAYEHVPLPDDLALVIVHSGVARTLEGSGYATRKRELEEGHPRRRRHIETENDRVRAVVAALRADDRDALGRLFREGHDSLRDDLEVTTPELDRLVDLAYAHGAVAARMTGGGFGGAIVALVAETGAARFADAVVGAYGRRGRAYVCRASDGARELPQAA